MRKLIVRIGVGCLLVLLGLVMWSRNQPITPIPFRDHGTTYEYDGSSVKTVDFSAICDALTNGQTEILLSARVIVTNPEQDQGLFQTDENEEGLFVEYQKSEGYLVRFGLPLDDGSVARTNIKNHTRDAEFNFVALVRSSGAVRVVTDTAETRSTLSGRPIPNCLDSRLGEAAGLLPFAGTIRLSVSTSSADEGQTWERWIDDYRRATTDNIPNYLYQIPMYSGLVILLFGAVIEDLITGLRRRHQSKS